MLSSCDLCIDCLAAGKLDPSRGPLKLCMEVNAGAAAAAAAAASPGKEKGEGGEGGGEGEADDEGEPTSIFDSSTHCLHGVIHCNGFGHLLRMNGRDGEAATAAAMAAAATSDGNESSAAAVTAAAAAAAAAANVNTLAGPELMGLWDKLCSTLRAREVRVCGGA